MVYLLEMGGSFHGELLVITRPRKSGKDQETLVKLRKKPGKISSEFRLALSAAFRSGNEQIIIYTMAFSMPGGSGKQGYKEMGLSI